MAFKLSHISDRMGLCRLIILPICRTSSGTILLGCDKTRGHFNPALFFARHLASFVKPGRICFYPVKQEWRRTLQEQGFAYSGVPLDKLRGIKDALLRLAEALWVALRLRPAQAVGFGGRKSFFSILLLSLFIPTAVYEPNAALGKANLALSLFVRKIFSGYPDISIQSAWLKRILAKKMVSVGIPLKPEYFSKETRPREEVKKLLGLSPEKPVLLAFGGSSGAMFLNTVVQELVCRETKLVESAQIVHLTGTADYARVKALYRNGPPVLVKDFSEEMWKWYAVSDAIICRAGASSLAEINYFNIPAVVIPLPGAYTHQYKNVEYFSRQNGLFCVDQQRFDYQDFKNKVYAALFDASVRERFKLRLREITLWNTPEAFSEIIAREMGIGQEFPEVG